MSIYIDERTYLLVQGITGRQAYMNTLYMEAYGTNVCAGVTPGKGGTKLKNGIPVFNTVAEAIAYDNRINTSVLYVPARALKQAVYEALDAGIKLLVLITERAPHQDVLSIIAKAEDVGATVVGPNSIGMISPGKAVIGLIGARVELANKVFTAGNIGVLSRSGGQTTTLCSYVTRAGYGQSTAIGIGGDEFVGTTWAKALLEFEKDPDTKAVVAFGEIGGIVEEEAAKLVMDKGFTKLLIVYVSGKFALDGIRYGHAGAIVKRGRGSVKDKEALLRKAGVIVLDHLDDVGKELGQALK
ncbi:MAG: succinate--CoA ligase subunit alpha [Candidatus Omnitrophica bacterium]|nr:succinate--CoA ligase subunit alpha [Candidatus Omnitrophota bacterium]MBU1128574.1 succinate--CoA ligase subunit alpha [Candidatus Omnitrophota bacterium]MBU1657242.1 succinate--CoA ligase subunit alpha [Candidatus Omnitrophota bacterium]MBU1784787.1 succinate--CoA ligase subunit alpha [Candidatus Omnitrophota bacterium]MBU1851578.1 succinate--CoA ligase subunit alpha [Candidatus Omnitrophota bacterium]